MGRTITGLEAQKRNPDRVNVYLDGEFAFGLDALAAAALRVGKVLEAAEAERLQAQDAATQAFQKATQYLAARPRSIAEVRRHLLDKELAADLVDEVIERLAHYNYVNDREFAAFWLRSRSEFNPKGAMALRYELRQKGIANDIIDEALAELDSIGLAMQVAEKKLRSLRGKDAHTIRTKLSGYLSRRGFDYETVRTVLDQLVQEDDATISFDEE